MKKASITKGPPVPLARSGPDATAGLASAHTSAVAKFRASDRPSSTKKESATLGLCVREARADCQCGELIDRIAATAPVRKLLFVDALGRTRVPFSGYRRDHCGGITAARSSGLQSARIVQRKRRTTSNVDSMKVPRASSPMVHFREALRCSTAEVDPRLCVVAINLHRGLQPGRVV